MMIGGAVKKFCVSQNAAFGVLALIIAVLACVAIYFAQRDGMSPVERDLRIMQYFGAGGSPAINTKLTNSGGSSDPMIRERELAFADEMIEMSPLDRERLRFRQVSSSQMTDEKFTQPASSKHGATAAGGSATPYCNRTTPPNWSTTLTQDSLSLPVSPYATYPPGFMNQVSARGWCIPPPQKLGILSRTNAQGEQEILPLMGHPTTHDKSKFTYFTVDNTRNQNRIEIPGTSSNGYPYQNTRPEINDNDKVDIPVLGGTKFTATVYPYLQF